MRSGNWVQDLIHIRQKGERESGKGDVEEMGRGMKMGKTGRKLGTVSRYSKPPRLLSVTDVIRFPAQAVYAGNGNEEVLGTLVSVN